MTAPSAPVPGRPLRLGTRGSPLALWQANTVSAALREVHAWPDEAVELVIIKTSGDQKTGALYDIGGKGLFTKEIDEQLLKGDIDFAVHSSKDLPGVLPPGVSVAACLPREDPRDAFLSPVGGDVDALPEGATVGTTSPRRRAQLLARRPDLNCVILRGNVETRLRKLKEGTVDATLLALAGLKRLGKAGVVTAILEPEVMLPAVGQGIVAIAAREGDRPVRDALAGIDHADSHCRLVAERAFLQAIGGSCTTPLGGLAEYKGDRLQFRGCLWTLDGQAAFPVERTAPASHDHAAIEALGAEAGAAVRKAAGPALSGILSPGQA